MRNVMHKGAPPKFSAVFGRNVERRSLAQINGTAVVSAVHWH
jgi:hypothetical protein